MRERPAMQCPADAHPDLARRRFLSGLGSMTLLAGGFGSVLTTSSARAAIAGTGYASGSIGLELDGAFAGYLRDATGGEPVFDVATSPAGGPTTDKSVTARHSLPLELNAAGGMSASFYSWVSAFTEGQLSTRNGALVQFDFNRNPVRRLAFKDASIVAIAMPPLDASMTKDRLTFTVTILPQSSSMDATGKGPAAPNIQEKFAMASGFRLQIRDLENVTANARRIEGIGVKTMAGPKGGGAIDAGSLRVSFPESSAAPFYDWFNQCGARECIERPGVIQFMSPTGTTQLGAIELVNLGITRVAPTWSGAGSERIPLVTVDFYCEQQRFNLAGMAFA